MRSLKVSAVLVAALVLLGAGSSQATSMLHKQPHGLLPEELVTMGELRELLAAKADLMLIDARSRRSYEEAHIEGAVLPRTKEYYDAVRLYELKMIPSMPDEDAALREGMKAVPKQKPIVTYCNTDCSASSVLLFKLKGLGYKNVRSMEDGIQAWEKKGYPVIKKIQGL